MRLRRLDLTRYGTFTDHALDFGPAGDGPDLHVVYGPNEAGKSTALAGFLDLLYGIHHQSPYGFRHDYKAMEVGALLEWNGQERAFTRIKARQGSLRDGHGQPVGETALGVALGGIDRDAYRTMFSLDDDTLEQGGEDILNSRGDLGQLLFAASAGLSGLSRVLDDLGQEADRFHRKRAHKTDLAEARRALEALEAERKALDVQASEYARRVRERDEARAGYEAALADLTDAKTRQKAVERLAAGLERRADLRRVQADLAALDDLPEPPPDWHDVIGPLMEEGARLATRRDGLAHRIAALEAELDGLDVDAAALAIGDRLDRLGEDAEAAYRTAVRDLPRRRAERRDQEARIAALLDRLERPRESDARDLLLPASTVGTLRDLIARRSGIVAQGESARREAARAADHLRAAEAAMQRVVGGSVAADDAADPDVGGAAATAWQALGATVRTLRGDDAATRARLASAERDRLAGDLDDALAALAPWSGDADALAALAVPAAARVAAWRTALADADAAVAAQAREVARLTTERARRTAEIEAIRTATGVPDDAAAAARRAARDAAWRTHRAALDAATADAFAVALDADDSVTAARLTQATTVARLREAAQARAVIEADLEQARAAHAAAQAQARAVRDEIAAALRALGLPEDGDPDTLADWLARRTAALQGRAALRAKAQDLTGALDDDRRARARLGAAMAAAGLPVPADAPLAALLETAEGALTRHRETETRREAARTALTAARREAAERSRARAEAEQAEAAWRDAWAAALGGCWLGADGAPPDPAAVAQVLTDLEDLRAALRERDDLDHRIRAMERDQHAYAAALGALLAEIGATVDPDRPLEAADAARARVQAARTAAAHRERRRTDLTQAREERTAVAEALTAHATRAGAMTALFGVDTLTEVARGLRRVSARDALRARGAEAEAALMKTLRAPDPAAAEAALADADAAALEREAADLTARLADLEPRVRELYAAVKAAEDAVAAVHGDDAVARLEARRRTLLLEIEDQALRHLRLRLGIAAATQALTLYRERHRSAMLARAGAAFRTISRDAYAGLSTRPERDGAGEVLIALEAGGGSKLVSALSKGTRFQLYLALRVAGYHEIAARRPPVPFIADDIMETFDDFRAEEAFRLFAGMAAVGQVIYLTHHRHLCDIARAVCPGVTVHTLDGPGGVGA
ncbi:ATP-binding protein [Roseospira goensis]|uniref:Uncharacterized protein YhaN n=1 Tax=Roseospira goensis TaxID=391922 RepID=A0A7W6RZJ3_9PROT|nr:YhaN family protein [Roseospira goensis]MBB4286118.1 uncharacterized protein YhaN [Roseospira goensis]